MKLFVCFLLLITPLISAEMITVKGGGDMQSYLDVDENDDLALFLKNSDELEKVVTFNNNFPIALGSLNSITLEDALLENGKVAFVFRGDDGGMDLYGYLSIRRLPLVNPKGLYFYHPKGAVESRWYPDIMMRLIPNDEDGPALVARNYEPSRYRLSLDGLNKFTTVSRDRGTKHVSVLDADGIFYGGRIFVDGSPKQANLFKIKAFATEAEIVADFGIGDRDLDKFKRMVDRMEGGHLKLLKIAKTFKKSENLQRVKGMIGEAYSIDVDSKSVLAKLEDIEIYYIPNE